MEGTQSSFKDKGIVYTPASKTGGNVLSNAGDLHYNRDGDELPLMKTEMCKSSLTHAERSAEAKHMIFSR